ncbi:LPS assembly lipoprotein LptE [Acetobacter sp. AN02]|uniref:LPS assembly lipoprotein LptE n=1 Tax=Acetobacter sp. AN02 TaxID=2894186 RepID=UPI0024344AD2|nr:LPS assembly lipoprotein LptE [Acetobacter sp. AN02]MDG6094016.1 LPS assembly lipoprotein LptE [Acetobacter sp. AN02]
MMDRVGKAAGNIAGKKAAAWLRTGFVLAILSPALAGCGFHPLYGTSEQEADVAAELKKVYVAGISDRPGQLLRLALQENMAGDGPEEPDGYTLRVSYSMPGEAVDIHADNTSGRTRMSGYAHWRLYTVAQSPVLLAQGDATTLDGMTVTYQQVFAQNMNMDTVRARIAQTLAEQITQQVSIWFRGHRNAPARPKQAPVYYQDSSMLPTSSQEQPQQAAGEDGMPALATGRDTEGGSGR